jgi:mRNA-degrading endonuclease RelE of RelBE toxin-antitoxin system
MTNAWKDTERLVHLIEKSLNPGSVVLHNQHLTVVNSSSGRTRQCDVVIITGNDKRKTVTIVEVQERNAQVDINTFNGWLEKMREVGAQHLVCVSRREYPASVIEKANQLGSTVLLVNFNQSAEPDTIPLQLINSKATYSDFDIHELFDIELAYSKGVLEASGIRREELPSGSLGVNEEVFSLDGVSLTSLYRLARAQLELKGFKAPEIEEFTCGEPSGIYFQINGTLLKLKELKFKARWSYSLHYIPPTVMTYDQLKDGTLAWLLEFKFKQGERSMTTRIPFTGDPESLLLSGLQVESSHDIHLMITKQSHGT